MKDRAVFAGGAVVMVEGLRITHGHLAAWTQKTIAYSYHLTQLLLLMRAGRYYEQGTVEL